MTLPATSSASSLATSGSASPSPSFKKAKASYEIEQTLQFNNPTFEEAFRADAFRLVYLLHCALFSAVIIVLLCGLFDDTFRLISIMLLPIAAIEVLLRIALHYHTYFEANLALAQRVGARAMVCLTPFAWSAYAYAAHIMRDEPPASMLMSAILPITLVSYPVIFGLFMLSPTERALVAATTVSAIICAPRWSSFRDDGEGLLHLAAILLGCALEYSIERMMRVFALRQIELSVRTEKMQRQLIAEMEGRLRESERREASLRSEVVEQMRAVALERQKTDEVVEQAEVAEQTWSDHQKDQRLQTEKLERKVYELEVQLEQEIKSQMWRTTVLYACGGGGGGGDSNRWRGRTSSLGSTTLTAARTSATLSAASDNETDDRIESPPPGPFTHLDRSSGSSLRSSKEDDDWDDDGNERAGWQNDTGQEDDGFTGPRRRALSGEYGRSGDGTPVRLRRFARAL